MPRRPYIHKIRSPEMPQASKYVVTWLLLACFSSFGQERLRNAVYAELGGNGLFNSINYERTVGAGTTLRIGGGFVPHQPSAVLMAGQYIGKGAHLLDFSAGLTYTRAELADAGIKYQHQLLATAFIGYRYQQPGRKFLFKAGFTPFLTIAETNNDVFDGPLLLWAGVACGYRF